MMYRYRLLIISILLKLVFTAAPIPVNSSSSDLMPFDESTLSRTSDNFFPTNPLLDRAKGFLMQGKLQSAITNYGSIVDGFSHHPGGLWGEYTYFPSVSFMFGVPGQKYSSKFDDWDLEAGFGNGYPVYSSLEAAESWMRDGDSIFIDVVFEVEDDKGILGERLNNLEAFNGPNQWFLQMDDPGEPDVLYLSTQDETINPSFSDARIGLVYPWAKRAKFVERDPALLYDIYDYGPDDQAWTEDDVWYYYGANSNDSWFTRFSDNSNSDWQPKYRAREITHSTDFTIGDIFGEASDFTDSGDPYPVLAHSNFSETWPNQYNNDIGEFERTWPGWWAEVFDSSLAGCDGTRKDDDCWYEDIGSRFISDTDVYMEFDDRWAHQGNYVKTTGDEYVNTGYPLGVTVRMEAHSYGVSFAEDIMFVTVRVKNESGDYINDHGEFVEAMVMPDGTKLNGGKGFDYERCWMGFYMDVDAVWADYNGGFGFHSNADDAMGYYRDKPEGGEDSLSFAYIYDYDDNSNGATNLAYAAVELLDSPTLPDHEDPLDFNRDGNFDIFPGDKLGMTDWHWFDWYNRPGVRTRETNNNCCDGTANRPSSENREEIQFKLMSGDTTNISPDEQVWFFHTPDPQNEVSEDINPHFDSMDGLMLTEFWQEGEEGMDCVLIMSTGPFDLKVGEEKPFSFGILMGADLEDLIKNAQFAQIMYDSHYQGFTAPDAPLLTATVNHEKVTLNWTNSSENSLDVVTRYSDFEGYKLYKSTDNGLSWGEPIIVNGVQVGWEPLAQWDLTYDDDINHCIYQNDDCSNGENRASDISGWDPFEGHGWFNLGNNSGLEYTYTDTNVIDGVEYSYSLTAYDMGVQPPFIEEYVLNEDGTYTLEQTAVQSNPGEWAAPDGASALECARGTTILDPNFVKVIPGYKASNIDIPDAENGDVVFVGTPAEEYNDLNNNSRWDNAEEFEDENDDGIWNNGEDFDDTNNNGSWDDAEEFNDTNLDSIWNYGTLGTGSQYFRIVNEYEFEDELLKFEINAELNENSSSGNLEGLATENPKLFGYFVDRTVDNNLIDYEEISIHDLSLDSIAVLLDMPGATFGISDTIIRIPNYIISNFPIYPEEIIGQPSALTDIVSGLRFGVNNIPEHSTFDTDDYQRYHPSGVIYDIDGVINGEHVKESVFWPDDPLTVSFTDYLIFSQIFLGLHYFNLSAYNNSPIFDYRIDFSDSLFINAEDDSSCVSLNGSWDDDESVCYYEVAQSTLPGNACNEFQSKTILPFKITNLHTGNKVGIIHTDKGIEENSDSDGYKDCIWSIGEKVTFNEEFRIGSDEANLGDKKLFDLYLSYISSQNLEDWDGTGPYGVGDHIYHNGQEYVYTWENTDITEPGVFGETPWVPYYPWQTGDYLIVKPIKKYIDGDTWLVDLEKFGLSHTVTKNDLEKIKVVPNPYLVRSGFNEDQYHNYIRFTNLPQECTITIFTVSGEKVNTIKHNDQVDGNEFWNMRNRFNQVIAPGLYLYAVESGGAKHLGKFAVVR